jgi:hypothetical protein
MGILVALVKLSGLLRKGTEMNMYEILDSLILKTSWRTTVQLTVEAQVIPVVLIFRSYDGERPIPKQIASLAAFLDAANEFVRSAISELRAAYSKEARNAAEVDIELKEVLFTQDRLDSHTEFALLFESELEPELGLSVRFGDGEIEYVGIQDGVL